MKSTTDRGTTSVRILLVDDEAAILRFLKTVLDSEEFCVYKAENGRLAIAAAAAVRPDLILLDLGLPDMDGVEVIKRIRDWSKVPIIVLSVREREDDKIKALDAGADDYLTKPFGVGELLARIRVALRRALQTVPAPVYKSTIWRSILSTAGFWSERLRYSLHLRNTISCGFWSPTLARF